MKKEETNKEPAEDKKQDNWNIKSKSGEEEPESRLKPEEMEKDKSNKTAKKEIDEEGYIKNTGYQDIPPAGNDPAKNKDLKAPEEDED